MDNQENNKEIDEKRLSDLLESTFGDFLKPVSLASSSSSDSKKEEKFESNQKQEESDEDDDYADKMSNILEDMMKQEPKLREEWKKLSESCKKAAETESDDEAFQTLSETLKKLSESAQSIGENGDISDEELAKLWGSISDATGVPAPDLDALENDESYSELMPLVTNLMQNLLSKQVLYPSIKDLSTKYPVWLEENRMKIESAEYDRYSRQLELMNEVCAEFDAEQDDEPRQTRDQRFQRILVIMQKMKDCGSPPKDLVGDAPDLGADLDFSKIPSFDKLGEEGRSCAIM